MGRRDDASGRVDPKRIGSDQFDPKDLSNRRTIDTLLPYMLVFNGDSIIHTITLEFRQGNGPSVTTTFTIAAGGACGLPTLPFAAIASDSAGTPSSVKVCYSDIEPAGFKTAAGGGGSFVGFGSAGQSGTVADHQFSPFQPGPFSFGTYSTDANARQVVHRAGTVKNLSVNVTTDSLGVNATLKLMKNGVDTALSVTITGAGLFEDTTHAVTFADGDTLSWDLDLTLASVGTLAFTGIAEVIS